ncbi:gluconate 2-dehydrogenase subunit 3 family protein [Filobacillus milosensis]|uniref:Gluconate 2-dehydrogenase subunit 3 family protein n=1 Tax=Filobacillus milosensis TaxID=94137 RepID=A0A4Y8IXD9_9BACI|nr:gluconate 2-dehydrogenase subunit 3 family protein [Filobacillus milosensis]TFB25085.1 gluconate 2-dehydrogenase subunit 3 family protein [Filobacillus milosensis]
MTDEEKHLTDESRRKFLKNSGYFAGGLVGGGILGSVIGWQIDDPNQNQTQDNPNNQDSKPDYNQALKFFQNQEEFELISAAAERIFPEDENGPGAIGLGVAYFIDHELAGDYGNNEKMYMHGPFKEGTAYQGFQSRLKRKEIFREGMKAIERESQGSFDDSFVNLDAEQQDEILQKFANDKVKMRGAMPSTFFSLLKESTLAGAFADPLYGGNLNMDGWRMKEFPGSQMSYLNEIESEEFVQIEPQSLYKHLH